MEEGGEESKRGSGVYQSAWAAVKHHRLCGLTTETYFLTVLEAEVQNQGARMVGFPWGSHPLSCRGPPPCSLPTWLSFCVSAAVSVLTSSSNKDQSDQMRAHPRASS